MAPLVIYGDFNCPYCALASARADLLIESGSHDISWRAIQHDTMIPKDGEPLGTDAVEKLAAEVAQVFDISAHDLRLRLVVPRTRSNTALASEALAGEGASAHRLRRRLFAAVWAEGRNISDAAMLDSLGASRRNADVARAWQGEFESLDRPITPTIVLPDGCTSRGLGALSRLEALASAMSV
jgi:predicted DsbA family dithiol-disulfide isomerase